MDSQFEYPIESLASLIDIVNIKPILDEITIIIPTLGRPILETCLVRIVSGNKWPGGIIIVDQGDSKDILEWVNQVKSIGIKSQYYSNHQPGKSTSLNLALHHCSTRFFAITDDDCIVEPDWVVNIYEQLKNHPDWIITGRVEPAGTETVAIVQSREPSVQYHPRIKFDSMAGGNMGTSIEVIKKIGFFNESPMLRYAAEDSEFAYRALKSGIPIAYAPEVVVSHFGWRSNQSRFSRYKAYAYGQGGFYGMYLRKADRLIMIRTAFSFARALRRWLVNTIKGDKELAKLGWAYLTGMLPGIIDGIKYRQNE